MRILTHGILKTHLIGMMIMFLLLIKITLSIIYFGLTHSVTTIAPMHHLNHALLIYLIGILNLVHVNVTNQVHAMLRPRHGMILHAPANAYIRILNHLQLTPGIIYLVPINVWSRVHAQLRPQHGMILHAPANAIKQVFNHQEQIPGTRNLVLIFASRNNVHHQLQLGMLLLVHANVKSLFHAQLQHRHGTNLLVRANALTNLDVVV